jgi:hypothetical protein
VCVAASQVNVPPAPQFPVAPSAPHPAQAEASTISLAPQVSPPPHDPGTVEHAVSGSQAGWQQPPAGHVIPVPVHVLPEHASFSVHTSPSSQAILVRQAQVPPALVQR